MTKKILSIIVPSYNMEAYLPKCLGSLIIDDKELLQKLDVIVVNDGSKDHTSEIAHNFETKYPGVFRVIDKENGHYGSCINVGLSLANGVYVKILDADDYVRTDLMVRFCQVISDEVEKGDLGADLFISNYSSVDSEGNILNVSDYPLDESHGYYTLDEYTEMEIRFALHSIVYRISILRAIGYHQSEGINYTDNEWIIEPMSQVRKFIFFKSPITCYLVGRAGQSMEHSTFAKNFQQIANITANLVEHYDYLSSKCVMTSKRYYYTQVSKMVKFVYLRWLTGWGRYKCKVDIDEFERRIKGNGVFYEDAEQLSACIGGYCYYCVRDWRKWHSVYTPRRILYVFLFKLDNLRIHIKNIIKRII